ncbi:hypothetical protein Zmor_003587 [Zophobas morio]|uniref:Retrotransposon gag domain-containing protein n=1 Tax=Zophobas morio TaxID=2755281 RepID=A0AA38HLR9_9CUCU|nr:hypothetical protein Zmor_003587 [Zophobas morio]
MTDKFGQRPITRLQTKIIIEREYNSFKPKIRSSDIQGNAKFEIGESSNSTASASGVNLDSLSLSNISREQTTDPKTILENSPPIIITPTNEKPRVKMTDVTMSNALESKKTPAIPNFISPEIFDPKRDDPERFLKNYERAVVANAWDNNLKIIYFGSFLSGIANRWYEHLVDIQRDKKWEDVKKEFLKEFQMSDYSGDKEMQFENRKQGKDESVKEFFFNLLFLAHEVDPDMTDQRFIKYFEKGMLNKYFSNYKILKPCNEANFRGPETVPRTARAGGKLAIAAPPRRKKKDSCLKLQGVRKCWGDFLSGEEFWRSVIK